ncbi:MAG: ABC transporter ATP-binding protein [Desulfobacteraceae bacterium]|nr:ABC transporter ATP-binding protein [Desulfobacteraceae bacterium]
MLELKIQNLSKTYENGVEALKNIDLTIPTGMFGLLGPNGAGKSTLMHTIAALQAPDQGSIMMGDLNVLEQKQEVRKILGYLPQEFGLYPTITAEDMLNHFALLKGIGNKNERREMVAYLLHQTDLYCHRHKKLKEYSGGMKQRLGIAQALLGNPKLIVVDEPTAGLDLEGRSHFLNLFGEIGENVIVILSTHMVEDVKELCSQMAIISLGEVLLKGEPTKAIDDLKGKIWEKIINKEDCEDYKRNYKVISTAFVAGKPVLHVFCDTRRHRGQFFILHTSFCLSRMKN